MNKRGQFFLLAAVIIAALIISLGAGTNRITANEDPGNFYDFGYEVKREVGAVLDYSVYTNFDEGTNLTEFVDLLADEIMERSPGSDFIFIYGNSTDMDLRNYGSDSVYADGSQVDGFATSTESRICLRDACQTVSEDMENFDSASAVITIDSSRSGSETILIEIDGNPYEFELSEYKQVIFIMKKEVDGDRHIIVG